MSWLSSNWRRFFHRGRRDRDLDREIAAHFNEESAENIARGLTPEEAARRARIKFGSERRVHEDLWQQNSVAPFENLTRDLRYTVRTLARTPGFTLTAILVMALDTKCHNDLQPGIMVLCPRWRQKIWEPTTAHRPVSLSVRTTVEVSKSGV